MTHLSRRPDAALADPDALCAWCGQTIAGDADPHRLQVQDPVGRDDLELMACCAEHATQLRHRHTAS